MYDVKKLTKDRITYIENDDEWFYIGTSSGELIITNDMTIECHCLEIVFIRCRLL